MAFCVVTQENRNNINLLVKRKILDNPAALKNFKDFAQEIAQFLMGKNVPIEKVITLMKYVPEDIVAFTLDRTNRDLLKKAGVSMDAIRDVEDQFDTYESIAKFLGIKNESVPLVLVNENQLAQEAKVAKHIQDTKVTFEGDVRIVNGKKYSTRVTSIAKVGFDDPQDPENQLQSAALKHGNTVDTISKAVFDELNPQHKDFAELIEPQAFDTLVAKLKAIKSAMQLQGFVFQTGVTVYDKGLGVSGEIDLLAITPEGEGYILDFKTAKQRFNESYLKNENLTYKSTEVSQEVGILSKWKQYGTQGYIYAQMLQDQVGLKPVTKTGIIGINISYDANSVVADSKITKVVDTEIHNIPFSDVRSEFKGKTMPQIVEEYKKLEGQSLGPVNEVKSRKPLPNRTNRKKLDRLANLNETTATEAELQTEVKWFTSNPIGKDTLLRISDMVNIGLFGQWSLDGITLWKNASKGTVYHEGWHRFSQVFMSLEEKFELYKTVQNDAIKFRTRDGRTINTLGASFLDVEEFLADEFAKFALNPAEYKYPAPRTLFQKILDFLKRFFGINNRPIDIFQKLYSGKIGDYVPSVNNTYWGKLNSLAENSAGQEIVTNERFPLYVRSLDYLVGKELRDSGKSFTAFKQSKRLQSQVLNNVFSALEERYSEPNITDQQAEELYNIITSQRDFTKAYLTATAYDTLKDFTIEEEVFNMTTEELAAMEDIREQYEDVEDANEQEDDSKPERFDRTGNEDSAFSVADDAIQDFFRTIPKIKKIAPDGTFEYELNELGFPENHKFYDVFYKTKKILSGAFDMAEMQQRMEDKNNQRLFPELSIVNRFIGEFMKGNQNEKNFLRAVQNVQFVQAFYHVMSMPEVPNMQLTMNFLPLTRNYLTFKPTMVSYRTASRNLSLKIIKTWEKNFKDRRGKGYLEFTNWEKDSNKGASTPLYLTEDGKLMLNPFVDYAKNYPSNLEGIRSFWEVMGVTFNEKVFQDRNSVLQLQEFKNILTKNITIYKNYITQEFLDSARMNFSDLGITAKNTSQIGPVLEAMPPIMMDLYAKSYYIGNPVSFFNEKRSYQSQIEKDNRTINIDQTTDPMRFLFEDMASIEEKFGDRVSSGSFRIEDKTKYPYYIPNQLLIITELVNKMQRTTQFADNLYLQNLDPVKNSWMKRSYFMKRLFDNNGARTNTRILVEDIASVRMITEDGILEKSPRSLNKDEKFFMDVLTLFRAGAIEIPRAETSSTMFSIRLSDYGKGKNLPITLTEALPRGTARLPESFHAIVKDYFAAEIEKRQWFKDNDPDIKGANKIALANQFNVFEGILPKALRDKVVEHLDKSAEEIFGIGNIETEFRNAIEDYFVAQINEIRPRFDGKTTGLTKEQQEMLKDTIGAKTIPSMLSVARAFVLNHFILSQEFYNLYFGDLYYYKNAFKRGKYVTNTGNGFYIDDRRNELLNSIQNSTMHSIFTGEKPGGKDFRFIRTSIMKDVEMKSSYVHENDTRNLLLQGILAARLDSGALTANTQEYAKFVENTRDSLVKYDKINIADGQGIIGLDFYRNFSIITNIWDEKKEREYERQKAIFRSHYNLYHKLDEGKRIKMEGEELNQAKAADKKLATQKPHAYFNPLKISYTGPQAKNGPTRPVFDKFSVRPIIPEGAISKRDENLMLEMVKQDVDYVKFQSGSKVYQDTSFEWYNQISDGTYDLNDFTTEEIEPSELLSGYLKHQLSTEGFKDENIFGSQFRKIVFGVKYTPMVRNNPALLNKFSNLEKRFKGTVDELIKVEQTDLFSLLGVQEDKGVYRVDDMKKFLTLLQTESIKRGVAINNIDYIQYDENTKNAKYPIDYAFNRQQIQDLLSGLIDERLRRLKVNGSSLIQVSSAGTENVGKFTNATRAEIERYGTTGLHYYHMLYNSDGKPIGTSTMGVKVALIGEYENLLNLEAPTSLGVSNDIERIHDQMIQMAQDAGGNPIYSAGKIGTLERLNKALQDPEWKAKHAEKFRMVGYRIPTQNINFTDHMEIMEFLPKAAGAIIIPPIELIVKSGSDFDIDKMNVLRPSIDRDGRLVSIPRTKMAQKDGSVESVPDTLDYISDRIAEQTYDEKQLRTARRRLKEFMAGAAMDIGDLLKIQRAVRLSILDLTMKAGVNDAIVDKIMDNIINGARVIIPEYSTPEDVAFTDEDILDAKTELERVTAQYQVVDQEVERLKERYTEAVKERDSIDRKDMKWFNKKRDYKSARNNELVDILATLMSHPYYFELLVTPSSASMFEAYTNELMASQENMNQEQYVDALIDTEGKLFDRSLTPQETSTYAATSEAFDNLLSKRKDLGGYAIQRTFADVFNFAGFSIAKDYPVKTGRLNGQDLYGTKVVHTPLIAPSDRVKSLQNGKLLMHGDSVNDVPISKSFDELISLTVDLAGAPAYPHMGVNNYNKKHFQYLIHQKTDPKMIMWFMNQPVLRELFKLYEDKRRRIAGYALKHAMVELSLRMKVLKNEQLYENSSKMKYEVLEFIKIPAQVDPVDPEFILEPATRVPNPKKANQYLTRPYWDLHTQNLTATDFFSFEDMDAAIRDGKLDTPLQKKVLAYFASISEEADLLMKLQFAENVDTTKYATLTSLIRNQNNRRDVHASPLFSEEQINRIESDSMIAPFDYTQKAMAILKTLFPKLYTNRTISTFAALVNDIWGAKNLQIERISKIIENDFIEYIYKNYGVYKGQNLSDYFQKELMNTDAAQDHQYFSYRLNAMKAEFPELLDIPFVAGLYEDVYFPPDQEIEDSYKGLDNKEIHNIFFLRNPDNPTFEKNIFTNNWRNLINFDAERLGLADTYTEEAIKKISEFFHELVYFSLYQAGLTNTGNGFSDLIPYEYWTVFIEQSFDTYDNDKERNSGLEVEMLREFEYRFRQMNPKVNWRTKTRVLDSTDPETGRDDTAPIDFFRNYYRGKDYRVSDDDLFMAREIFLRPDEELEDNLDIDSVAKPKNAQPFASGVHVDYQGDQYVLVKLLKTGMWQIFNPNKTGSAAKLAAREVRMTTLPTKDAIVYYGEKFYLVTPKREIIDIETNVKVNWLESDRNRVNILVLAEQQQKPPEPPADSIGPEGQPPIEPGC